MKYSIITPVYNGENYISNYVKMLNDIDYDDFELIVIDDCSTDGSFNTFKEISNNSFKKTVVKSNSNKGAGSARNIGLSYAKGDYIIFFDVDDRINADIFKSIDGVLKDKEYDCVMFDTTIVNLTDNSTSLLRPITQKFGDCYFEKIDKKDSILYSTGCICGKVYKRSVQSNNNIVFPETMRFEDMAFNKIMLSNCCEIMYLHESLYEYVQYEKSVVHRLQNNAFKYAINSFEYAKNNVSNENKKYLVPQFMSDIIYFCVTNMIESGYKNKDIKSIVNKLIIDFTEYNLYKKNYYKDLSIYVFLVCKFYDMNCFFVLRVLTSIKGRLKNN